MVPFSMGFIVRLHADQSFALADLAGEMINKIHTERNIVDIHENITFRIRRVPSKPSIKPVHSMLAIAAPIRDKKFSHFASCLAAR